MLLMDVIIKVAFNPTVRAASLLVFFQLCWNLDFVSMWWQPSVFGLFYGLNGSFFIFFIF